ncbi:hypothetical protein ATSB10_30720 [Dyella thiooxydans]|uniref:Uncharacterized protein n=1 Tax=Dyella thiooxydans TaxID=445710 RepID=A0A160N3H2_9GAMM|nr:DUF4124 domain-containing protein [Dyella thiooxydans]AND70526.1 hypothetical protein ATSB10_30720 [Dyella thiooxydans]
MRKFLIVSAMLSVVVSTAAIAQQKGSAVQYRWHDAHGLLHYSDSLSADAMANGYDIVDSRGIVVRHVERQLTVEERAAAEKQAAIAAAKKQAEDEQRRNDDQMLAAYPNEPDLVSMQKDELNSIDQQISTTRKSLATQEQALADLLGRAGELERTKQPVPKYLSDRIATQRGVVGSQRALLERLQQSYVNTQLRQESQLSRYRALKKQIAGDDPGH